MNSIRSKLSLFFIGFMVCLILIGMLLNGLFLEKFYIYKNRVLFDQAAASILTEYERKAPGFYEYINQIDRSEGISSSIADRNLNTRVNSFPTRKDGTAERLPVEIASVIEANQEKLKKGTLYQVVEKEGEDNPKLVYIKSIGAGDYLVLRKSMKGIGESVGIANQFYLFSGLLLIGIGSLFIFTLSKRAVNPIIEMSNVAKKMSELTFDQHVAVLSNDEIGNLGKSINNLSDQLSKSLEELKEDVSRRKVLVRNMSHELKTPIGVIKGYAEALIFGVAEDKRKADQYCHIIAEECDRMDKMVRELLDLSMMESGAFNINMETTHVKSLIQKVLLRFRQTMENRNIRMSLSCDEDLYATFDPVLIERAVNNYVLNGIHHVDENGLIEISAVQIRGRLRIEVFNTGGQIPEMEIGNVWDVFYKLDKARSRNDTGHGLGLSIVRMIAELHGGSVGVENRNNGVAFYLQLNS